MLISSDSGSYAHNTRQNQPLAHAKHSTQAHSYEKIHFGIQRKIVAHMTTKSWQSIPHASYLYEPDITEFFEQFKKLRAAGSAENRLTLNTLLLRALVEGLKAAPLLNAHIDYNDRLVRGALTPLRQIDISMPWILPGDEMMTVKLRHFEDKSLAQMSAYIQDTQRKIDNTDLNQAMYEVAFADTIRLLRKGKLLTCVNKLAGSKLGKQRVKTFSAAQKRAYRQTPESDRLTTQDLSPGSVTISNIGSVYLAQRGMMGILEVIPPQVFAVGIGAAQEKPAVYSNNGTRQIGIRTVLPFCLSFDHRALDFAQLVPFMKKMDEIFAEPQVIWDW